MVSRCGSRRGAIFVIGFGRDEPGAGRSGHPRPGWCRASAHAAESRDASTRIQRIDGLPPKKVNPSAEHLARIQREVR